MELNSENLAGRIQHTLASNTVRRSELEAHVKDCLTYGFHAAMVPPFTVEQAVDLVQGSNLRVASWVDFPMGVASSKAKEELTGILVESGVREIDLLPNVGFLLDEEFGKYESQIRRVVQAAGEVPVKVMLELPLLPRDLQERALQMSIAAGVAAVKNASSGTVGTADPEQIRFLRTGAPDEVLVKASGGIRTLRQAEELLRAGADLIGTSSGVQIMHELAGTGNGPEEAAGDEDGRGGERY